MNSSEFWLEILDSQVKSSVMDCSIIGKNQLIYDNLTKSYLINLKSTTLMIPKASESLKVSKPVMIFLLYIFPDKPFTFEFVVVDSQSTQKRILLDGSRSIVKQSSYAKIPNKFMFKDCWVYMSVDISSLFSLCFDDSQFKYIETVNIHGTMLIRKIVASESCYSEFSQNLVDMGKVNIKIQDISKHWVLKLNAYSPSKNLEIKPSPKEVRKKKVVDKGLSYFSMMKSDELRIVKNYEKSTYLSPQPGKVKQINKIEQKLANVVRSYKNARNSNRNEVGSNTPTELLLNKEIENPNYFQQFSLGLLNIRHETPPFVASRSNIFYNPVQKKYDSL